MGWHLSFTLKSSDWLSALGDALNKQFPQGVRDSLKEPLYLISDNCRDLNIKQIFTSYNNPKGNTDTERVLKTLKEDLIWIKEFSSVEELRQDLKRWVYNYNAIYPHSSLNYKTPLQFEEDYYKSSSLEINETQQIFS